MGASELDHRWKKLRTWAKANLPWVCGLCGAPISRDIKFPDPMSWSLDHIIPLAKDPGRVYAYDKDYVQPAHLRCNGSKQDGEFIPKFKKIDW